MSSRRIVRVESKESSDNVGMDAFIERLKKARALNCNASYLGLNGYVFNRVFDRPNLLKKFL